MNTYRKTLIFVILLAMLASGCSKPTTPPITQIVAFGDSLSDNGASMRITQLDVENKVTDAGILPPSDQYWEGRWSNGPMAVEVLAQRLQVKLTDYAVGGAESGLNNINPTGGMNVTGLLSQLKNFQIDLQEKKTDPDALYFIFISANDFLGNLLNSYSGSYSDVAEKALENIQTAVTKLSELGAKRFLVVNSIDLAITPMVVAAMAEDVAKEFQNRFDSQLPIKMADLSKQLNIEIIVFDLQGVSDKIRSDPQMYGLKNLADPCMADLDSTTACNSPDEYFFWDPVHLTRRVHQIVGEAMAAVYGK